MVSRALRAILKSVIAGGSAPTPWVTFFARAKKVTKESTPRDGATSPCASRRHRRAPQLASRQQRGLGSNTRRANTPIPAAMLGRAIRGGEQPTSVWYAEVFSTPSSSFAGKPLMRRFFRSRSARRVPQPHRELSSETVFEPEARFPAPGELVECPVGRGTEGTALGFQERRALRGHVFLW